MGLWGWGGWVGGGFGGGGVWVGGCGKKGGVTKGEKSKSLRMGFYFKGREGVGGERKKGLPTDNKGGGNGKKKRVGRGGRKKD